LRDFIKSFVTFIFYHLKAVLSDNGDIAANVIAFLCRRVVTAAYCCGAIRFGVRPSGMSGVFHGTSEPAATEIDAVTAAGQANRSEAIRDLARSGLPQSNLDVAQDRVRQLPELRPSNEIWLCGEAPQRVFAGPRHCGTRRPQRRIACVPAMPAPGAGGKEGHRRLAPADRKRREWLREPAYPDRDRYVRPHRGGGGLLLGAQTGAPAATFSHVGAHNMPLPVIRALALIKRVAAEKLPSPRCAARYSAISITTAASHGHLELNAYKPVVGFALVQLADAASWSVASPATRLTRHGLPIPAETSLIAGDRLWRGGRRFGRRQRHLRSEDGAARRCARRGIRSLGAARRTDTSLLIALKTPEIIHTMVVLMNQRFMSSHRLMSNH
jgi:hypothetical protein